MAQIDGPQRQSQIIEELTCLDSVTQRVQSLACDLEQRLSLILRESCPEPPELCGNKLEPVVPLAQSIKEVAHKARTTEEYLHSILDRLEI